MLMCTSKSFFRVFSKTERNVFWFSFYEILLTVFSNFTNRFRFSLLIVDSGFFTNKLY